MKILRMKEISQIGEINAEIQLTSHYFRQGKKYRRAVYAEYTSVVPNRYLLIMY